MKRLRAVLSGSCSSLNMHDPRWPDGASRCQRGGGDSVLWGVATMFLMMDNANNATSSLHR